MTPITEEMIIAFSERTKEHIEKVNYFGRIIGFDFSDHDKTKWDDDKVAGFILSNAFINLDIQPDEEDLKIREKAIFKHVKSEPHHPEYWDETCTWESYSMNPKSFLENEAGDNIHCIDARKMDKRAMIEMCADWCSVSDELGTDPQKWASDNFGTRWLFTKEQEEFLNNTLELLWTTHQEKKNIADLNSDLTLNQLAQQRMSRG